MSILDQIIETKLYEIRAAREQLPLAELKNRLQDSPIYQMNCRDFYRQIAQPNPRGLNVIAEVKRASPSAGNIHRLADSEDFQPEQIARQYQQAGANAISVLTDEKYFKGKLQYLQRVHQAVTLPTLRKDFIIDPYQVYQARSAGADAILLIAEALDIPLLTQLAELAWEMTMTVLLEIHSPESLGAVTDLVESAQQNKRKLLLGINNRNLKTMQVDLNQSITMAQKITSQAVLISESGIKTRSDVERLIEAGFQGVLIGETLMASSDISAKFQELFDPKPGR